MTATNIDLRELLEKTADTDFLREMIGFTAQRLMELEVETLTGATFHSPFQDFSCRKGSTCNKKRQMNSSASSVISLASWQPQRRSPHPPQRFPRARVGRPRRNG
jgi:hypothetical protein